MAECKRVSRPNGGMEKGFGARLGLEVRGAEALGWAASLGKGEVLASLGRGNARKDDIR
jgi:hypothetical protein